MNKNKAIPSMFHRRLLLLLAVCVLILMILSGQIMRLSLAQGAEHLAAAEARLDSRIFLPTHRGSILDRHGRVLAIDRASYDVAVDFRVICGAWGQDRAYSQARRNAGKTRWFAMSRAERQREIDRCLPEWTQKTQELWSEVCRIGAISADELHRRLDEIKAEVVSARAAVQNRQRERERERLQLTEDEDFEFRPQPIVEERSAHIILPRVADDVAIEFKRLAQRMPGMLEVQDSHRREYPWMSAQVPLSRASLPKGLQRNDTITIPVIGVADHILGAVRDEVWASDIKRRPFRDGRGRVVDLGGYEPGDVVGSRGVERVFEDHLRGMRGQVRERIDTGEQVRTEPLAGNDLQLTLDIALQARVQAIMSPQLGLARVQPWHGNAVLGLGAPLNAAAVVLEVETGEILAMVSMPTLAMGEQMPPADQAPNAVQMNRPAEAVYPPGSIIKPLVLSAAVTEGVHNLANAIVCHGHYFENDPAKFRCWIYRERYGMGNHGSLRAPEALARSCNMFFYTLGDRLGMTRLIKWFRSFGLGQNLDAGLRFALESDSGPMLVGESEGSLPGDDTLAKLRQAGQLKSSEIMMGIGQGPIAWTPLQAANAYATLARGGAIRDATIVMNDPRGSRAQRCDDLRLSPSLVSAVLDGLRQSVESPYGTGHSFKHPDGASELVINAQRVVTWAKTGTAQAMRLRGTDQSLDHSWFVGLVGPAGATKPLYAISVIVERGGSGGRCAGPIANQIIRALQSEGYLPGDPGTAPPTNIQPASEPVPDDDGGDE